MLTGYITDRKVENGDVVNIDYEGKKDGVAFIRICCIGVFHWFGDAVYRYRKDYRLPCKRLFPIAFGKRQVQINCFPSILDAERVSDREDYVGLEDLDIDEYVTLNDYKNMKVTAYKPV